MPFTIGHVRAVKDRWDFSFALKDRAKEKSHRSFTWKKVVVLRRKKENVLKPNLFGGEMFFTLSKPQLFSPAPTSCRFSIFFNNIQKDLTSLGLFALMHLQLRKMKS